MHLKCDGIACMCPVPSLLEDNRKPQVARRDTRMWEGEAAPAVPAWFP